MPMLRDGERVAIWGFGREGRATFAHVRAQYPHVEMAILNDTPLDDAPDAPVLSGEAALSALTRGTYETVFKSPGISFYRPEIAVAKAAGVRFSSATNLWFSENPTARVIAVTGTKGKSSTARLVQYLLRNAGLDVRLYGNVGIPVLGEAPGADATVLEMSSYQIADLAFAPDIAVLTNLYPEHAPWHHGVETYYTDKLRILDIADKTQGVANFACERLRTRLDGHARVTWFNTDGGFCATETGLRFAGADVALKDYPLKGAHNFSNLAAACAAADAFGVRAVRHTANLDGFHQLAHRLEECPVGGVLCVNDSLCTVPEATIAALKTYPQTKALILGGTDRGQDYGQLAAFLPTTGVRAVYLMPVTGARIGAEIAKHPHDFAVTAVADLETAVRQAFRELHRGDAFLLSPAAPSFGQFRNYEDRGESFKALCRRFGAGTG